MSKPEITVLMTVYNGAAYLRHSIESVLCQTFKNFEFLIIDDYSRDDSLAIIKSYKDSRIVVHSNPENKGQSGSLNIGLRLAKADYVARLDADDLAFPRWLEKQLSGFKKNAHFAAISAQAAVIDARGRAVKTLRSPLTCEKVIVRSLISSPINHVGSLMRKNVILKYGGYDESFKIASDYKLWSRLIQNGEKIISAPDVLVAIRVHENSLSAVEINDANFSETSRILRENISFMTEKRISDDEAALLWKTVYQVSALSDAEFKTGVMILEEAYGKLKPSFSIEKKSAEKFLRNQLLKVYVKRIFSKIRTDRANDVRAIAGGYMRRYGFISVPLIFYVVSFFGKGMMELLPQLYEKFIKFATIFKTKIKYCS